MEAKKTMEAMMKKRSRPFSQVYWVACGGSLIDLYPAHYMLQRESRTLESGWFTSAEYLLDPPKKLGPDTLLVVCSHSGCTAEAIHAAEMSQERGAEVIALTQREGSPLMSNHFINWIYPWGEDVPVRETPGGLTLLVAAELLRLSEGFDKYDILYEAVNQMDLVIRRAVKTVRSGMTERFAELCETHPFLYILGSGASFAQAYGFSICSLMEMQWQNCCYIHSGEYFHGPFEVTEPGVFYFLQKGSGPSRVMDQRAERFLRQHTEDLMVVDTMELGMGEINESVREYVEGSLLYAMNVEFRSARAERFHHPVERRRYMGVVEY